MRSVLIGLMLAPAMLANSALPIVISFDRPQSETFWRVVHKEAERVGARIGERFRIVSPDDADTGTPGAATTVRVRGECRISTSSVRPISSDFGPGLELDCVKLAAEVGRLTEPEDEAMEQDILAGAVIDAIAEYVSKGSNRRPAPDHTRVPRKPFLLSATTSGS
jgi:hypothetical protein